MEAFERIKRWASTRVPGWQLNPGADPDSIKQTEIVMDLTFPNDLKQYLLTNDGQTIASDEIIGDWELLSLDQIVKSWKFQREMVKKGLFAQHNKNEATPFVKGRWWNTGWIPIAHSSTGDYYCVDTDPSQGGRRGQVILFWHDEMYRPLVAHSLEEWFRHIADDMESGRYDWITPEDTYRPSNNGAFIQSSLQDWKGNDMPKQPAG